VADGTVVTEVLLDAAGWTLWHLTVLTAFIVSGWAVYRVITTGGTFRRRLLIGTTILGAFFVGCGFGCAQEHERASYIYKWNGRAW